MSDFVAVMASSLMSRLFEAPVRFRELQFCALTVNDGALTAPVMVKNCRKIIYLDDGGGVGTRGPGRLLHDHNGINVAAVHFADMVSENEKTFPGRG